MANLADLALQHLLLRLRPLNRALRAAVHRQSSEARRLIRPDISPLCVTEDQVLTLLRDMDVLVNGAIPEEPAWITEVQDSMQQESPAADACASKPWTEERCSLSKLATLTPEENAEQEVLRTRAAVMGFSFPLDRLVQTLGLTAAEEETVLLCAATELDRSYERIYAYILDDLNRRYPCVELLCSLTVDSVVERVERRHMLSRFGSLRRTGVLQSYGEPPTELRQELRLSPGLFDFLTGGIEDMIGRFRDPADVAKSESVALPSHVDRQALERLVQAMREGRISVLGIWGEQHSGHDQVVLWIAANLGIPVRRCLLPDKQQSAQEREKGVNDAIQVASALGAILWIATEPLSDLGGEPVSRILAEALAISHIPVLFTGTQPWRPLQVLEMHAYTEIELAAPGYTDRKTMWAQSLPDVSEDVIGGLAARFRVGASEIRAAARLARTEAELTGTSSEESANHQIERACAVVTRKRSHQFATVIEPKRGAADLILTPNLHNQVLEVARFFQAWPRVAEEWGFARLQTGKGGGVKALFTGDSGTGKTLAAEVIAGKLSMPLLKVDLARIVSKWVGVTEQHLEAAFREAEDSHCVLFFDECDALFGKRGEVQHGVDRYANLEVSFLLQRLEDHYGLVILASNLKENIDKAFTRRFQAVIHFPKPESVERRRIWEIAFPKDSPLDPEVDLDALSRLDMNGAAIVGAACTAALMAVDEKSPTITKNHIVRAIARQYQREARILTPAELGNYATELKEAK